MNYFNWLSRAQTEAVASDISSDNDRIQGLLPFIGHQHFKMAAAEIIQIWRVEWIRDRVNLNAEILSYIGNSRIKNLGSFHGCRRLHGSKPDVGSRSRGWAGSAGSDNQDGIPQMCDRTGFYPGI